METLHREIRQQRSGTPTPLDVHGNCFRNITGWRYNGKEISERNLFAILLHRISRLEDAVCALGLRECKRCGGFMGPDPRYFYHDGKPVCDTCIDYLVVDEPEGFKVKNMARYILQNRDRIPKEKWEHWANYLSDDDDPENTDLELQMKICSR